VVEGDPVFVDAEDVGVDAESDAVVGIDPVPVDAEDVEPVTGISPVGWTGSGVVVVTVNTCSSLGSCCASKVALRTKY
jgi:hypothetical protein